MIVLTTLTAVAGFSNAYMNKKRGKSWISNLIVGIIFAVWTITLL